MAKSTRISAQQRDTVRRQLGELLAVFRDNALQGKNVELLESFAIYELSPVAARDPEAFAERMQTALRRTGIWHHQLIANGTAIGVAHSDEKPDGSLKVTSVFLSDRANKFATAINTLDQERTDDGIEAQLVVLPSHRTSFFILRRDSQVEAHVIVAPAATSVFSEGRYYPIAEFLRLLAKNPRPGGLTDAMP
jgi:hypothetical protein